MKLAHKALAFLLVATGAFFPLAALSANGVITTKLTSMALVLSPLGYRSLQRTYHNVLPSNTYDLLRYNLTRGYNYSMIAACDDDECQDIDLVLYGPSGNRIGSAMSNDTSEAITFLARESGQYQLQVVMRGCILASCEYGARPLYQEK